MSVASSIGVFGVPLVLTGIVLGSLGCIRLVAGPSTPAFTAPVRSASSAIDRRVELYIVLAILAVAGFLRLSGLGARSLMHPEIYIPGIDLPASLSEPPPRHGFLETLSWHFHWEPHPFGYYMAMWVWTKAFGASIVSIRLPEALLGLASIPLLYRVGALTYGRRVGLLAAALLAMHGFHIFWSQAARMYAPGAFFGLVATLLMLELSKRSGPRRLLEAGYVASLVACALTVEFAWPLMAVHMLWAALNQPKDSKTIPRLSMLQAMAAILAMPMLSHAVMTGRNDAAEAPSLAFLIHYFSFGFAFEHGAYSEPWAGLPPLLYLIVLIFSLTLIGLGLSNAPREKTVSTPASPDWPWRLVLSAAGSCVLMLGFMALAYIHRKAMTVISILPWLAILIPATAGLVRPLIGRRAPWLDRFIDRWPAMRGLIPLLAILPVIALFIVSFKLKLTAPRAFLIFVPYLLVLVAAGVDRVAHRRLLSGAVLAGLLVAFAASAAIIARTPGSPREYRDLAAAINARRQPGDLVFTPFRNWKYTPLLVYLPHQGLVAAKYAEAATAAPGARIWVPSFDDKPSPAMTRALDGYRVVETATAQRASAALYVRSVGTR